MDLRLKELSNRSVKNLLQMKRVICDFLITPEKSSKKVTRNLFRTFPELVEHDPGFSSAARLSAHKSVYSQVSKYIKDPHLYAFQVSFFAGGRKSL